MAKNLRAQMLIESSTRGTTALMANAEHLALLRRGVYVWSSERPDAPDLRDADLRDAGCSGTDKAAERRVV